MSAHSRTARVAAASLTACVLGLGPAAGAFAREVPTPGPPVFPTATENSITVPVPRNPGPPVFPTATRSSVPTHQPTPAAIDTSSSSVSAVGIVGIALGSLALGFAASLLLLRLIPRRTARV